MNDLIHRNKPLRSTKFKQWCKDFERKSMSALRIVWSDVSQISNTNTARQWNFLIAWKEYVQRPSKFSRQRTNYLSKRKMRQLI